MNRPPGDPIRLLDDDSDEPKALRDLVRILDRHGFDDVRHARLEAMLLAHPPVPAHRRPAVRRYRTVTLLAAAVVVLGGMALAFALVRSSAPLPVTSVPTVVPGPIVPPVESTASAIPSAEEAPRSQPSALVPRVPSGPSASAGKPDPSKEERLLRRGRQVLGSNPARALAITQEHARRFPKGMLSQERQVLAIDALVRLGRRQEAAERAVAFIRANPRSAYRERLRALIPDAGASSRE